MSAIVYEGWAGRLRLRSPRRMGYISGGDPRLNDLKLGSIDEFHEDESDLPDEKARLAELISEEFSDHKELSAIEARLNEERKLRLMFSKRFEEMTTRSRELETALATERKEAAQLRQALENARAEVDSAADWSELEATKAELADASRRLQEAASQAEERGREVLELREQVSIIQAERDLQDKEDPEGRLARLRSMAEERAEEADRLRQQVEELESELEMRMAVHEGLRQDFAGTEELRERVERLQAENAEIRDHLTSAVAKLDMIEDADGIQIMVGQAMERAENAERERDAYREQVGLQRERSLEAQEQAEQLRRALAAASKQPPPGGPWKGATGVLGAAVLALLLRGPGAPDPAPTASPAPTRPPIAEVRRAPRDEDQRVLEAAALAALDQKLAGLSVAPPPRVALRGDLDEFSSLLARIARGEEAEPTLEIWKDLTEGSTRRARVAAHTYAKVLVSLGKHTEAKRLVEVALALDPEVSELHALYGRLLLAEEDLVGAEESFRAAIGLDDEVALAHGGLAQILELSGREAEAQVRLERALELQPQNPQFHYALAMLLRTAARWEDVVGHLEATLEARPDDAYAHWYLAEAYGHLGKDREATEHKMRAYKLGYKDEHGSPAPAPEGRPTPSPPPPPSAGAAPSPSEPALPAPTPGLASPSPPATTSPGSSPAPPPGSHLQAPLPGLAPAPSAQAATPGATGAAAGP